MPPKIDLKYGILNDIGDPKVARRINLERTTFDGVIGGVLDSTYKTDAVANTGPYKAVVLRIEPDNQPDAGSWLSAFFRSFNKNATAQTKVVRIKARIPEIHAMLPIPEILGPDSPESGIIDMYPTFEGQGEEKIPDIGSLVWVDFVNKNDFTDPIYLRPVDNQCTIPFKGASISAKNTFCVGGLLADPPIGDTIAGKNLPSSHIGPPLSKIDVAKKYLKENILLKGSRYSSTIVNKWIKSLEMKKIYGKSWIGGVKFNGEEDLQHPKGKRDTVIFVPHTTDFSSQVEIIYFFHNLGEFGNSHDFRLRFTDAIRFLVDNKRNFVLVIPELPWSAQSKSTNDKSRKAWEGDDKFGEFYKEINNILKNSFSNDLNIGFITIVAHGYGGGSALNSAILSGISEIKINKIVFSNAAYEDFIQNVWGLYVSKHTFDQIEYDILSPPNGMVYEKVQSFIKENFSIPDERVFIQLVNKGQKEIGDMSLTFVNPDKQKKKDEMDKNIIEKDDDKRPFDNDEQAATQELPEANLEFVEETDKSTIDKVPKQVEPKYPIGNARDSSSSVREKETCGTRKDPPKMGKLSPMSENRVRVSDYGSLNGSESLLELVPSVSAASKKAHRILVKKFDILNDAWIRENPGFPGIKIASAWRKKKSYNKESYDAWLVQQYGSVEEGRKWVAYESPHETGLAIDIGNNGLEPNRITNDRQKQTRLYKWMVENAYKYGFTPYKLEAWHWECRISYEEWVGDEKDNVGLASSVGGVKKCGMFPTASELEEECSKRKG